MMTGFKKANLTGELELDYFAYFDSSKVEDRDYFWEGDLTLDLNGTMGGKLDYTLIPRFRLDAADKTRSSAEFLENSTRRPFFTFAEAKVASYGNICELQLGKQLFNWGTADGYNPTDDLNPTDFLDLPTSDAIGVPALSLFRYGDPIDFQFVYVPFFTPSRLPPEDNRWFGNFTEATRNFRELLQFEPVLILEGRELPAKNFENSQLGIRLSSSTLLSGWDLALSYYWGHDSIGVFRGELSLPEVRLTLIHPEYQEIGVSFSTTFGSWEIHGEGSYHLTDDNAKDDDYLQYVIGANYAIYSDPFNLFEEIRILLEYAGESTTLAKPFPNEFSGSGQYIRPFDNSLLGNLSFKVSEYTHIDVSGALNIHDGDYFLQAVFEHKIFESMKLHIDVIFYDGSGDDFFARWKGNNRVSLTALYFF